MWRTLPTARPSWAARSWTGSASPRTLEGAGTRVLPAAEPPRLTCARCFALPCLPCLPCPACSPWPDLPPLSSFLSLLLQPERAAQEVLDADKEGVGGAGQRHRGRGADACAAALPLFDSAPPPRLAAAVLPRLVPLAAASHRSLSVCRNAEVDPSKRPRADRKLWTDEETVELVRLATVRAPAAAWCLRCRHTCPSARRSAVRLPLWSSLGRFLYVSKALSLLPRWAGSLGGRVVWAGVPCASRGLRCGGLLVVSAPLRLFASRVCAGALVPRAAPAP